MLSSRYKESSKSIDQFFLNSQRPKLTKSWSLRDSLFGLRRGRPSLSDSHESQYVAPKLCQLEDQFYHPASRCDVWRSLCPQELPDSAVYSIMPVYSLSNKVFASITGPKKGLLVVKKWRDIKANHNGYHSNYWKTMENRKAHGISVSLYEKNLVTGKTNGGPIADAFVVRARHDSAYLAVADGVNWGNESMKAARSAISAIYTYLESHLYGCMKDKHIIKDTRDAAQLLFEAFSFAQEEIVSITSGLTTLCVALILPVITNTTTTTIDEFDESSALTNSEKISLSSSSPNKSQFAVVIASVGDCQAFLLSKFHGIREITGWTQSFGLSSDEFLTHSNEQSKLDKEIITEPPARDFRDTGGALGAVYKNGNPELNNLICAVTLCDPGDIVLLGSDGLVDNFDPVITRLAVPESPHLDFVDEEDEHEGGEEEESSSNDDLGICDANNNTNSSIKSTSSLSSDSMRLNLNKPLTSPCCRPSKSWLHNSPLTPPPQVSIWPQPPPPPPDPTKLTYTNPSTNNSNISNDNAAETIYPHQINFTNQLELNWYERRRYAAKELERVWHELDMSTENNHNTATTNNYRGTFSSKDLCEALINYAYRITTKRREWLENPEYVHLRQSQAIVQNNTDNHKHLNNIYSTDSQRKWFMDMLKRMPGKLDHATVVAYEVGVYHGDENEVYEETAHQFLAPNLRNTSSTHHSTTHLEP
ncbi:PP2C-like domain-containing protein isoform 2 [Schistosoma japonicum]|uniref:PP2C-like domain-containing protein isoform 2 n=4 Tax=Schistosoma japonicum TaxID=6182 RepID=A0A4Z2DLH1_SCHJA|nr:PP2C-like domain-containing protein isoform 2 [Schistosoma japonicum]